MLVQFGAGGYRSGVRIIIKLEYLRQGFSLAPEKWLIISENLKASWKQNKTVKLCPVRTTPAVHLTYNNPYKVFSHY